MALGKTYKVISIAKSRKGAEGIAGGAEDNGIERVRIKKSKAQDCGKYGLS